MVVADESTIGRLALATMADLAEIDRIAEPGVATFAVD